MVRHFGGAGERLAVQRHVLHVVRLLDRREVSARLRDAGICETEKLCFNGRDARCPNARRGSLPLCLNGQDARCPSVQRGALPAEVDAGVGVALDAARVAHCRVAEQHRVERRSAAKADRLLQQLGYFLLHHLQESAPTCRYARRVRKHLELRTGDRHVFARRGHAWRRFVGRDYEHSAGPAEEHVLLSLAQLDRGNRQPARQKLRSVAMTFDGGNEIAAEGVHRLSRREARERERARVASCWRVSERQEDARKRRAIDVRRSELPHGTASAEPVLDRLEAGQRQPFDRRGVLRAHAVERDGASRTHGEAVLALHAAVGKGHARRAVLHLKRPEGAVANTCAAFDAFGLVHFKNACHRHCSLLAILSRSAAAFVAGL